MKNFYKHYKGGIYYKHFEIAKEGMHLIVYEDLEGNIWVREKSNFYQTIKIGNEYRRFYPLPFEDFQKVIKYIPNLISENDIEKLLPPSKELFKEDSKYLLKGAEPLND